MANELSSGPWTWRTLWPDPASGAYMVDLEWAIVDGRPTVIGVTIRGYDSLPVPGVLLDEPPRAEPIVTTDLRLPLHKLLRQAVTEHRLAVDESMKSPFGSPWASSFADDARAALERGPKRAGRPPKYDDEHFSGVAVIYNGALRDLEAPIEAIMRVKKVPRSTAAKWVARARQLGYLPPTTQGRAKGRATV